MANKITKGSLCKVVKTTGYQPQDLLNEIIEISYVDDKSANSIGDHLAYESTDGFWWRKSELELIKNK